jgi:hypothetical protein
MGDKNIKDKDMKLFLDKLKEDCNALSTRLPHEFTAEKYREQLQAFYNAYYAYRLAHFTKWLAIATIILSVVTGLQLYSTLFGKEATLVLVQESIRTPIVLIFYFLLFVMGVMLLDKLFGYVSKWWNSIKELVHKKHENRLSEEH